MTALAIEPTHLHLLITPPPADINSTCKWLARQITKAIRQDHDHPNPVFAKGKWATLITEESHWLNAIAYINRHPHAITQHHQRQ